MSDGKPGIGRVRMLDRIDYAPVSHREHGRGIVGAPARADKAIAQLDAELAARATVLQLEPQTRAATAQRPMPTQEESVPTKTQNDAPQPTDDSAKETPSDAGDEPETFACPRCERTGLLRRSWAANRGLCKACVIREGKGKARAAEDDVAAAADAAVRACRVCGCTDDDCSGCVVRTGEPCSWVADDLCSACADDAGGEEGGEPSRAEPSRAEPARRGRRRAFTALEELEAAAALARAAGEVLELEAEGWVLLARATQASDFRKALKRLI